MKSAKQLREQRAAKKAEMMAFVNTAKAEKRDLSADEKTKYDALKLEFDSLATDLERQEGIEALETADQTAINNKRQADKKQAGEAGELKKLQKRFSYARAIHNSATGKQQSGVEAEVTQEGEKEARSLKLNVEGVAIPASFMRQEQRDSSVGTGASAGVTVDTDQSALIEFLYPRTVLDTLGATIMTGMTSNYDLIRQNGGVVAEWEGEVDDNAKVDATYENVPMRPKRLGAYTVFSKQLVAQSSLSVENEVRMNLETAIGIALETAAINGSGSGNVPKGILNFDDAETVAIGTNGGAPTRAHLLSLIRKVMDNNNLMGNGQNFGFLATNGGWEKLSNTLVDAGSGRYVWEAANLLMGYNATTSNLVPGDLAKGSGSNLHALIFGNFSQLIMGQWGGLDLVVDPYTLATKSQIRVVANSWWDINARHENAFAVIKDAVVA
jgi:HK97 family phage major capsid protein